MGTENTLEGHYGAAQINATCVRYFEQHIAVELKQSQALPNHPKIGEMYDADLHTLVKFYRSRIPCSCLDEKYEDVKSITKMGDCHNEPKCNYVNGRVERSKTMYCSRCRCATYCSRDCQEAHWAIHKQYCDEYAEVIAKFEAKQQNRTLFKHRLHGIERETSRG